MRKLMLICVSMLVTAEAQTQHLPRGTAVDISNAEVQATVQKTASMPVSDQAIRVVNINGEYNVGVGVVHRAKTTGTGGPGRGGGVEHSQITEVYHVISGNATLVTGGTIENPRESAPDSNVVTILNGPSTQGGTVSNGLSRQVGPGDVVIIPPNTPHYFSTSAKSLRTRLYTWWCESILTKYYRLDTERSKSPRRREYSKRPFQKPPRAFSSERWTYSTLPEALHRSKSIGEYHIH